MFYHHMPLLVSVEVPWKLRAQFFMVLLAGCRFSTFLWSYIGVKRGIASPHRCEVSVAVLWLLQQKKKCFSTDAHTVARGKWPFEDLLRCFDCLLGI